MGVVRFGGGFVRLVSVLLGACLLTGGDFRVYLQQPETVHGSAYASPNNIGLYRMAFAVEDIQQCYRQLLDNGVDCPRPPVYQYMGEDVGVEGVWALFFFDPDGICIELIETPKF